MCDSAIIEYLLSHDYEYIGWHGFAIGFITILGVLVLFAIAVLLGQVMPYRAACALIAVVFLALASVGVYLNVCLWVEYREELMQTTRAVGRSITGGLGFFALLNLIVGVFLAREALLAGLLKSPS